MRHRPHDVAVFLITCPACREEVSVTVRVLGIDTHGLALTGVRLAAVLDHPCREAPPPH